MTMALLAVGLRSSPPSVGPGGKLGTMTLVRGREYEADAELWGGFCDPFTPTPGRYNRTCSVPRIHRLFIGYGDLEPTLKASRSVWKQLRWELWLDGRRIDLPRFGTSERTLYDVQGSGKNMILREWNVILTGATPGKHVIRYRTESPSGTTDATWAFTIER
jgi:hypothetical protein